MCLTIPMRNAKINFTALEFERVRKSSYSIAADVMELADMQDLGSCAARRAGSSPVIRIKTPERRFRGFCGWRP